MCENCSTQTTRCKPCLKPAISVINNLWNQVNNKKTRTRKPFKKVWNLPKFIKKKEKRTFIVSNLLKENTKNTRTMWNLLTATRREPCEKYNKSNNNSNKTIYKTCFTLNYLHTNYIYIKTICKSMFKVSKKNKSSVWHLFTLSNWDARAIWRFCSKLTTMASTMREVC